MSGRSAARPLNLPPCGGWALVTGAARGLGESFTRLLAAEGFSCLLVGLEGPRMEALAEELSHETDAAFHVIEQDLAAPDAVGRVVEAVGDRPVGMLIHNAGIGCGGAFETRDPNRAEALIRLSCLTPALLTRHYLPDMLERGAGAVVFVSSIMGVVSAPYEAVYSGAKAFNLHFGEALWGEMRGRGVDVLTVYPAGMRTEFFALDGIPEEDVRRLHRLSAPPERIARLALRNLGRKPTVAPWDAWVMATAYRLAPRRWGIRAVDAVICRLAHYLD